MGLDLDLVRRVRANVHARIRRTPIVESEVRRGQRWFWKLEGRQVTGSFKVRGPLAVRAVSMSAQPWVTSSAGNHGLGVAWAARPGPVPHVFLPRGTPEVKRGALEALGAHLHVCDGGYDATEQQAREWAQRQQARFVSPFDDDVIMAGNGGTLACEILEQLPGVETILVPIGGGGLASGLGCVVRALRPGVRLVGVQSTQTDAMAASWRSGHAVLQQQATATLAEGLEGGVSERSFAYVRRWFDEVLTVDEPAIASAIAWLHATLGERAEGSAAVVAAALRARRITGGIVCAVLTGSNIDPHVFEEVLRRERRRDDVQGAS